MDRAKRGVLGLGLAGLFMAVAGLPVQAALTVQGNATVYDDNLDIAWDQDGNAVKTLCDANDPIWQSFDPSTVTNNSGRSKTAICDDDGRLNWYEAEAWVGHLSTSAYKGLSNWRQWMVAQPDPTCSDQDANGQDRWYRCTASEMPHLFNVAAPDGLGNPNDLDDGCDPNCLQNTGPFINFQVGIYLSGTQYAPNPTRAWRFDMTTGSLFDQGKDIQGYVWAVYDRPVEPTPVPGPGVWVLGLLGMLLLLLARTRLR